MHGGTAEGLDYKLKGADSLARKIKGDQESAALEGKSLSAEQAAANLFDVNRYTIIYPEKDYAKSAQATIDQLKKQGYTLNVKNYWNIHTHAYQGINVQATGKDGSKFELQFHTPTSLSVKEGELHKVYEQQRVEKDPTIKKSFEAKMHAVAARIPIPPGVQSVKG